MSFIKVLRLAIVSASNPVTYPNNLEYVWYKLWTLALNLFLPTLFTSHGRGYLSITLCLQYWLFLLIVPLIIEARFTLTLSILTPPILQTTTTTTTTTTISGRC